MPGSNHGNLSEKMATQNAALSGTFAVRTERAVRRSISRSVGAASASGSYSHCFKRRFIVASSICSQLCEASVLDILRHCCFANGSNLPHETSDSVKHAGRRYAGIAEGDAIGRNRDCTQALNLTSSALPLRFPGSGISPIKDS